MQDFLKQCVSQPADNMWPSVNIYIHWNGSSQTDDMSVITNYAFEDRFFPDGTGKMMLFKPSGVRKVI